MTSRTTVSSLLALFTLSIVAAASCGGSGSSSSAPPPPKTTTSTSSGAVTSGGGEMSTSTGAGGTGGMGGAGGGGQGGSVTCTDMMQDGKETDKDCGGTVCDPCSDNLKCKVDKDCKSKHCDSVSKLCVAPSCSDGIANGTESDLDCGGPCPGCGPGQTCNTGNDCKGSACSMTHSCSPSCSDGVKNPGTTETDVDCGGACSPCANNLNCVINGDCSSNICDPTAHTCVPGSCNDGIQNGAETDIDCGGGICPQCSTGQKCMVAANCLSQICTMNKCACPPGMAIVPKAGGGTYCIDAAEVTNTEYNVFLTAGQVIQNLPPVCAYKANLPGYVPGMWPPAPAQINLPVSYVDWCDAYAYCAYSHKHLCGKLGGGANNDPGNVNYLDTTKSEWFNACTAQGNNDYPYGDIYKHGTCHGVDQAAVNTPTGVCPTAANPMPSNACAGVVDATTDLTCQGGVIGLYGMSGNLAEWENSCDDPANPTTCHVRGGSHCETGTAGGGALRCDELASKQVMYQDCDVGFRCCF